jgi:hypothetical protein
MNPREERNLLLENDGIGRGESDEAMGVNG